VNFELDVNSVCVCVRVCSRLRRAQDPPVFLSCLFLPQQIIQDDTKLPYKTHTHTHTLSKSPRNQMLPFSGPLEQCWYWGEASNQRSELKLFVLTSCSFSARGLSLICQLCLRLWLYWYWEINRCVNNRHDKTSSNVSLQTQLRY